MIASQEFEQEGEGGGTAKTRNRINRKSDKQLQYRLEMFIII